MLGKYTKENISTVEALHPEEDTIITIDFNDGYSIDVVSIDKHLYNNYEDISSGFEVYYFKVSGEGDYTPTGITFSSIKEVKEWLLDTWEIEK